jgi:uncharacterized protein YutE (UPF0331/DUF86 family)
MVDKESFLKHLEQLELFIEDLKRYRSILPEELQWNRDKQNMVLYAILSAIQGCIDMGNHIIAEKGYRRAETYRDIFEILSEQKVINSKISTCMKQLVGFRNMAVHIYWAVDFNEVFEFLQNDIQTLIDFGKTMGEWIQKE